MNVFLGVWGPERGYLPVIAGGLLRRCASFCSFQIKQLSHEDCLAGGKASAVSQGGFDAAGRHEVRNWVVGDRLLGGQRLQPENAHLAGGP